MKSERECAASAASLCFQQALPVTLQQQQHSPLHSIGQQPQLPPLLQPPPPPPPSIVLQHAPSNVPPGLGAETPASDQAKLPPADGAQGKSICILSLYIQEFLKFQEN
jgi:hypothetical protein